MTRQPISVAQHRTWFLDRLRPASAAYNVPTVTRLRGPVDVPALQRALAQVVERHDALRTAFVEEAGTPYQVVAPAVATPLRVVEAADPARLRRVIDDAIGRPFDLARAPLVRAVLARCAADDHVLALVVHHIVFDDWSAGVLGRELSAAYAGRPLGPRPGSSRDHAARERAWLDGAEAAAQLACRMERLRGAPAATDLPLDRPRTAGRTGRVVSHEFRLPSTLVERLADVAEAARCSPFMVLLTGFLVLLRRWTGDEDLVVAVPVANRDLPELEDAIGLFANTVALRVRLGEALTPSECLALVRPAAIEALAAQRVPYERVLEAVQPPRDAAWPPLAQCLFAFNPGAAHDLTDGFARAGLACEPYPIASQGSKFDLALCVESARAGPWKAWIELDADLFEAATAVRLAAWWRELLTAFADGAPALIRDLPTPAPRAEAIRVRGFPVHLRDVESVLLEHPDVEAAAAVAVDRGLDGAGIVAVVRWGPGGPAESAVQAHLERRLPAVALPAAIVAGAVDEPAATAAAESALPPRDRGVIAADLVARALRRRHQGR